MADVPASRGSALIPARSFSGSIGELGQGRDPEQAGAVSVRDDGAQAGEKIARFGHIHHVHVLDGERNALACQLGGQLVAMRMGAVEHGTVAPRAARLALPLAQRSDEFGALEILCRQHHRLNRRARQLFAFPRRILLAG